MKELPIGKKELKRRADGLSLVRAGLVVVVIAVARVFQPIAEDTGFHYARDPVPFYVVLVAVLGLTFLFRLGHRRLASLEKLLYLEICFDVTLTTFIVRWTGGVDSVFISVYLLSIVATSLFLSAGGGFALASLATLMFAAAAVGDRTLGRWEYSETYRWLAAVSFFYLTAFLAGFFSAGVQRMRVFSASLLQNLVSGVAIVDLEGRVVFLNPAAEVILGLTGREKGLTAGALFSTPSGENLVMDSLHDGTSRQREQIEVAKPGGTSVPIGVTVSVLKGRKDNLRGAVVSFMDLTDVRELEREVRLRDRMAALGTMSAGLAHEIRNPLASLSGSAELLGRSKGLEGDEGKLLDVILRESTRLNQIVTAFLEYCREEPPRQVVVELDRLLHEIAASVRSSTDWGPGHRIDLRFDDGPLAVSADPVQLRQCFLNLARNAAQAMPGGGMLRLVVHPTENHHVEVDFADEGEGMTEEQVCRIFDPFYSTREGGTGLGLSVVHRVVEAHRGSVRVESRPGEGTTFHVSLPAAARMTDSD